MKIFITGAGGLLSSNLSFLLKKSHEVTCLSRTTSSYINGVGYEIIDLADLVHLKRLCEKEVPDLIINTAGLTNVEYCEGNYYKSYTSNVIPAKNLAQITSDLDIKLVHISTDHFSDSRKFKSLEYEIELPCNVYASTKLEADREVLSRNKSAIILRTNFFGWGNSTRSSFSDFLINNLEEGKEIGVFEDVIYSPILIDDLLKDLMGLVELNYKGVFNICSEEPISKLHFAYKLAEVFDLNNNLITASRLADRKDLVIRPMDMSLSRKKTNAALKLTKGPSIEEMLIRLHGSRVERKVIYDYQKPREIINYGKQWITDEDIDRVTNVVCNKSLTQSKEVDIFEEELKRITGAKYAVAVANWTAGLHLSCLALGVKKGDVVVTSPNSFVASANCVEYTGGEVVFGDIDPETLNLCPKSLEKICQSQNVKLVIPVHFAGSPCDMVRIAELAEKYNFKIIEDAAHGLGGRYQCGSPIGSCRYADIVGFSFHPVKNIACGEGGAILTNNESLYEHLLRLRSHGIAKKDEDIKKVEMAYTDGKRNQWYYEMLELGYNYRITDLQCALGTSQLQKLDQFLSRRIEIAQQYDEAFKNVSNIKILQKNLRHISGNHLYSVMIDFERLGISRNEFHENLKDLGIGLHVHYIPIFMQPYYEKKGKKEALELLNSVEFYSKATTLPLYPKLQDEEVRFVIKSIKDILGQ